MPKLTNFKPGDQVCVRDWLLTTPRYGTVIEVARWKMRVLFPIRKFVWVDKGCCERARR